MADIIADAVSRTLDEAPEWSLRETADLAVNSRDLDPNDLPKRVDESIVLPSGTDQSTQIVIFVAGETTLRAENVTDEALGPDEFESFGDDTDMARDLVDETDFFVAEAELMQGIGRYLSTVLSPHGKMPTPLQPDDDVVETVNRMKNMVQFRSRDRRAFHIHVGIDDMTPDEIAEDINVIVHRLEATLEGGPLNIDSARVETAVGPSVGVSA